MDEIADNVQKECVGMFTDVVDKKIKSAQNKYLNKLKYFNKTMPEECYTSYDGSIEKIFSTESLVNNQPQLKRNIMFIDENENDTNGMVRAIIDTPRKKHKIKGLVAAGRDVLDYAKISISRFERRFRNVLGEAGFSVDNVYTDTDSVCTLIYKTQVEEINQLEMVEEVERIKHKCLNDVLDYSNYSEDSEYYDGSRKKQMGLMENEHPPPNLVFDTSAVGVKEYHHTLVKNWLENRMTEDEFVSMGCEENKKKMESKSKHKGVSKKIKYF